MKNIGSILKHSLGFGLLAGAMALGTGVSIAQLSNTPNVHPLACTIKQCAVRGQCGQTCFCDITGFPPYRCTTTL